MEAISFIWATSRDFLSVFMIHTNVSIIGIFVLGVLLLRLYCRLTVGICDSDQDMTGKTVLITGASSGIGKATALELARRNARIILASRNCAKAQTVAEKITSLTGNTNVIAKFCNLSSFDSVRNFAEDIIRTQDKLHVLINNAGIFVADQPYTRDYCETFLQVNHFGHFLLTLMLLDLLKKSAPSRIINVTSKVYKFGKLDPNDLMGRNIVGLQMALYSRSKLANMLFTRELASRLVDTGVTVNAVHPGSVRTDIVKNLGWASRIFMETIKYLFGKSAEEGAQTTIYAAVHPDLELQTGKYFSDCKERKIVGEAANDDLAKTFFEASEERVGFKFGQN